MFFLPVKYDEPLFRPPAEAYSAIIQATIGCSWNKCAFCEMYTQKKFKIKNFDDVSADIKALSAYYNDIKKVFIADGNAMVLSASKLIPILKEINKYFNKLQRISAYALPSDIIGKTYKELKELRDLGLKLLYIGIETGDEELLKKIHKGETVNSTTEGILKAHAAGIDTSIMIINGLGGKIYTEQHAINSAHIINKTNPKFLSTLTLSLPFGEKHFANRFDGKYDQLSLTALFEELKMFIQNIQGNNIIYRSNHISNNLVLEGILIKDKEKLIRQIDEAILRTPENQMPTQSNIL